MSLTEHLLLPLLAKSPAKPLLTHYDDAAGTRVELSAATLANWAAKTANWLVEEVDVEPGDGVAVRLPAHWQTAGVLLGAWWCGAHVVTPASAPSIPDTPRIAFVGPDADPVPATVTAVVALDALGRGLATPPAAGTLDYLSEARASGDQFSPVLPIDGDTPALLGSTVDAVYATARSRAGRLGIEPGAHVMSTLDWTLPGGVVDGLLAPLAAGAHVVQVSNADPAKLADRRRTERTTVDLLG